MADNTTQDQLESNLLAELDIFSSLTQKIDRLIMKRSEMTARIIAATAEVKQGNDAIKAELEQSGAANADPDVTAADEQALTDLEAAAADRVALGADVPVTPAPVDSTGAPTSDGSADGSIPTTDGTSGV